MADPMESVLYWRFYCSLLINCILTASAGILVHWSWLPYYSGSQLCRDILCCVYRKFMLWKMWCFTLQSMGRTNHKFPVYATQND